ncbi:MAG: hypothetical protein H8E44_07775 [Planctomycetes bacterium]|nr:hypothetical protein [Planctomycetota bacterium]
MRISPTEQAVKWFRMLVSLVPAWIACTQAARLLVGDASLISPMLAIVAALCTGAAILLPRHTGQAGLAAMAVVCVVLSWLLHPSGLQQYAVATALQERGYDIYSSRDKETFLADVNCGRLRILDFQQVVKAKMKTPPSTTTLVVFKSRRYVRFLFWPPLHWQAERSSRLP